MGNWRLAPEVKLLEVEAICNLSGAVFWNDEMGRM
jgi:hypothetical protein